MSRAARWLLLALLLLPACDSGDDDDAAPDGDDDNDASPGDDDDDDDEGASRPFRLAAAPYQYEFEPYAVKDDFNVDGFAGRVEVLSLHMDNFFGLPWDEFAAGQTPPAAWVAKMTEIRQLADDLGIDVYLSLTPLSGLRDGLGMVARDVDGELVVENNPAAGCYDFDDGPDAAQIRGAYRAFVRWMVDFFQPAYLTNAIELNIYDANCPDQYASALSLANEVYAQEKAVDPDLPIFATFAISFLWGYDTDECAIGDRTCLEAGLAKIADLKRDRFAISSYPAFMSNEWPQIPDDYFDAVHEITGERLVWAETGYGNRDVVIPYPTLADPCLPLLLSSDQDQIDYLNFLLEDADRMESDLVVWWSFRDFITPEVLSSCPCSAPGLWCPVYEIMYDVGLLPAWLHWGAMGMLDYAVQPKSALATWNEWLARPVVPPAD